MTPVKAFLCAALMCAAAHGAVGFEFPPDECESHPMCEWSFGHFCHINETCASCLTGCTPSNSVDGSCSVCPTTTCSNNSDCTSGEFCRTGQSGGPNLCWPCNRVSNCSVSAVDGICDVCPTCSVNDDCAADEFCDPFFNQCQHCDSKYRRGGCDPDVDGEATCQRCMASIPDDGRARYPYRTRSNPDVQESAYQFFSLACCTCFAQMKRYAFREDDPTCAGEAVTTTYLSTTPEPPDEGDGDIIQQSCLTLEDVRATTGTGSYIVITEFASAGCNGTVQGISASLLDFCDPDGDGSWMQSPVAYFDSSQLSGSIQA